MYLSLPDRKERGGERLPTLEAATKLSMTLEAHAGRVGACIVKDAAGQLHTLIDLHFCARFCVLT